MSRRQTQHRFRWIVLGLAITVGIVTILLVGNRMARHRRVEHAISRFESVPSQEAANQLTELLDKQAATHEQGKRILALLLCPKVTTRKAYFVGEPIRVTVESAHLVHFQHGSLLFEQEVWTEYGQLVDSRKRRISAVTETPETFIVHPSPQEPGTYNATICYECTVAYRRDRYSFWNHLPRKIRPGTRTPRIYSCRFDVPVKVNVAHSASPQNR